MLYGKKLKGRQFRKIEQYNPRLADFCRIIRQLRGEKGSDHQSTKIPLPFTVETWFQSYFLKLDKVGTSVLCVEIRAPEMYRKRDDGSQIKYDVNKEE